MALPDYTTQSGSTYKANIDGTLANISDGTNLVTAGTLTVGGAAEFNGDVSLIQDTTVVLGLNSYRSGATPTSLVALRGARGTEASPSGVQAGDLLGGVYSYGHDGSVFRLGTALKFIAIKNFTGAGAYGGYFQFETGLDGSTSIAGQIDASRNWLLGGNITPPASMAGGLAMVNGTAPTGAVSNGFALYSSDRNGAGTAWPTGYAEDGTSGFIPLLTHAEVSQLEGIGTKSLAFVSSSQDLSNKTIITKGDNNNGSNAITDSSPTLGGIYIVGNGGILTDHIPGPNTAIFFVYSDGSALQVTKIAGDTNTTASVTGSGTTITFTVGDASTSAYAVLQIGA